jgi:hypothetical protein
MFERKLSSDMILNNNEKLYFNENRNKIALTTRNSLQKLNLYN